jgi:hypothetical protein
MMDQLIPEDELRYERIKKDAQSDILAFRTHAHRSAEAYPRATRQLLRSVSTHSTPAYVLLNEWLQRIAPDVEALKKSRQGVSLRNTLAKQLHMSGPAAADLAKQLVDERIAYVCDHFLDLCYSRRSRARFVARKLLYLPPEDIAAIQNQFVSYELHRMVARELGVVFYDIHAPLLVRLYQKIREARQVKRYKKQRAKRLEEILHTEQELKAQQNAIISRILLVELDTVVALDAQRQYQKQLDRLKPESRTPAKRLSLFAAATKKIREAYASKQSTSDKLADLQSAQQVIDEVLVEIFDMTDAERNTLMKRLKEYRELEREAAQITKEQATYGA